MGRGSRPGRARTPKVERIRWHARQAGRAETEIGIEPRLSLASVPQPQRAEFVAGWRNLGATHLSVNTMGLGLSTADDHLTELERVLHALTGAG